MVATLLKPLSRCLVTNLRTASIPPLLHNAPDRFANRGSMRTFQENFVRNYAKKSGHVCDGCRRALKNIPDYVDPKCPLPCKAKKIKKKGILYRIKFKILQGGTNFGTPFRKLLCKERSEKEEKPEKEEPAQDKTISLPPPKKVLPVSTEPRRGVQVSILGADTSVGQYVALLLKQNPHVKKLRLYQSRAGSCTCPPGNITNPCRDMFNITQDLQHIDTNCVVQAFSCCTQLDLNLSLQNADIVLMLDDGSANVNMPFEQRFECQAPKVKMYAEAISHECPTAVVIVGTTPVDCMVPLVAETLKETGWYDKRKIIGSMAVPEMRASTLAARALSLEPRTTRVPCVGGTEGLMLVPLFSKTVTYFDFERDKLLNKLEENEPELATSPEEECVICVNAKATMQTAPCGHRVVCRRCFVKTIQMAVSQRLLPLRCVICRAKILRLRQAPRLTTSKSWQVSSSSGKTWGVPGSVSSYSVGARSVPASASLYSVTSGESSLSGVSSVSSNSGGNVSNGSSSGCSTKLCGGAKCGGACLGAVPRAVASAQPRTRQPASNSLRRSQHHSMKARLQEYQVHSYTGGPPTGEPSTGRLPPIREFQREFREGRRESAVTASASTRIRCAQKIVTQLETSPQKKVQHFFRPLKSSNKDDPPKSRDTSKETERTKENPKAKPKKEDKKKKEDENTNKDDKIKRDESSDNRKNEIAEKKKEEKLRLKAEKEAKKEAKLLAKEEERQAKQLAKEEERQAKLLAKEEKKRAKKEAKLAAQAEKEKEKVKT